MAKPEHLEILKQGSAAWNKWWTDSKDLRADLRDAGLRDADLNGANLKNANFKGADLRGANLSDSNLNGVNLSGANLCGAKLYGANLVGAELRSANLSVVDLTDAVLIGTGLVRADLTEANLSMANLLQADLQDVKLWRAKLYLANFQQSYLVRTDFAGAQLDSTLLLNIDLSVAKGLESVAHNGPSSVGVDTIFKSRGKIPEVFLRGCGVPDEFIAYIGSMVGRPIEFYSCFISYSTRDQEFAERLHADLQAKGVRCWFAPHDIKGGRKIHEQIDEAIRLHDRLLLILSEDSMKSDWVRTEIAKARKREKEDKRVLFPVRLVTYEAMQSWEYIDSSGKDLAEEIRQYFIPDFSRWKEHDSYQAALGRLVGDLKAMASG